METFGDRLKQLLENKHLSRYSIAKGTKLHQSTIGRIVDGENSPNDTTIDLICNYLLSLKGILDQSEIDWLRYGDKGSPLEAPSFTINDSTTNGSSSEASALEPSDDESILVTANGMQFQKLKDGRYWMFVPLVEQHAYAGYLAGWKDKEYIEELPKHVITVDHIHQGAYKAFGVRGDSMNDGSRDAICEGDIIDGRMLPRDFWRSKLHIHEYPDFVIVHHEGIVVKRIVDHDVKRGIIYCESLNPNKELYPDSFYRLSEVYELYNVVSVQQKRKRR
ncbi:helix-turn-helix domain-containing protein [Spirosoma sp. HMF4905]|uniref:Helix-turn-helix domain-containing protein n=1 Tax=Spirosoma arboris TaxID=2682092 RepID=A0A7K1SKU2_9BACT|nr:helix-turn-helix domain-containing protein [Spirosoma arboris]MVM34429.1 helix-turn-helix domain-containing protein [Spirosoma arboris]